MIKYTLSASEHSAQLRKAIIASTIGTAIEWYDFFLYGTAAGLIFGKLFFPNSDPLTATLAAFGTYFIGFVGRPIGAANLVIMEIVSAAKPRSSPLFAYGHSDLPHRIGADLCINRHLGCCHPDGITNDLRHRRWR